MEGVPKIGRPTWMCIPVDCKPYQLAPDGIHRNRTGVIWGMHPQGSPFSPQGRVRVMRVAETRTGWSWLSGAFSWQLLPHRNHSETRWHGKKLVIAETLMHLGASQEVGDIPQVHAYVYVYHSIYAHVYKPYITGNTPHTLGTGFVLWLVTAGVHILQYRTPGEMGRRCVLVGWGPGHKRHWWWKRKPLPECYEDLPWLMHWTRDFRKIFAVPLFQRELITRSNLRMVRGFTAYHVLGLWSMHPKDFRVDRSIVGHFDPKFHGQIEKSSPSFSSFMAGIWMDFSCAGTRLCTV